MKRRLLSFILAAALGARLLDAGVYSTADDLPNPPSHIENIPSGSLVIPMDNTLQAVTAPFNVKAYGLANYLLQNGIPLKWAISSSKVKDGIDFSGTAKRLNPTAVAAAALNFKAGPFIVHKDFAVVAKTAVAAFYAAHPGNNVAVYELTAATTADIRYDLQFKPRIGISTTNSGIHTDLLDFAFIPDYVVVADTTILASSCYTIFTQPHTTSTAGIPGVLAYVQAGGNLLCECKAVDTYENITTTHFQTTNGYVINNVNTAFTYPNANLAYSQFDGVLNPNPGGSEMDWNLNTGSVFQNNAHVHAQNSGANTDKFAATCSKLFNGQGGMVFYLGGHDYGTGGAIADVNGQRMILNAVFYPTAKFAACNQDFSASIKTISGTVYEDVNGDGSLSDGVAKANVNVRIYADTNNNGVVDAADTFLSDGVTDALGAYSFTVSTNLSGNNFLVVVDSKSVVPSAGLKGGFTQGDVWATQTYGDNPNTGALDVGPFFGGRSGATSDNYNTADSTAVNNNYQHEARIDVSSGNASNVNFGFSFNAVTNINGGGSTDDDASFNRTVQGSLRQFLQNANAITGANAMRFVPATAANAGTWWRISVTTALPAISDANTTIDGAAYSNTNGTTVVDSNAGTVGTGGTVGVGALALSTVNKPELEIQDIRATAVVPIGLDVQASSTAIRNIAIYGFGSGTNVDPSANIRVGAFSSATVEQNIIGASAGSFTDPGAATRSGGDNIRVVGGTSATIQNNAIGFSAGNGLVLNTTATGAQVLSNEIRGNGITSTGLGGILVGSASTATIQGNLLAANLGAGLDVANGAGANTVVNNTVSGNGTGTVTTGIRLLGASTTIDRNIVTANTGAGVLVGSSGATNTITKNSFFANTGIGIDLLAAADNQSTGTAPFVTINDNGDGDTGGNGLLNFPVITSANITGSNLVLSGYARPGSAIEFFIAAADPTNFGEGQTYVTTLTEGSGADTDSGTGTYTNPVNGLNQGTDNTNRFSFTIPLPGGVVNGTILTSTATLSNATSEFSGNVTVQTVRAVSGNVFEDVNYGGGAGRTKAASSGVGRQNARVELYDGSGNFVAFTTTDANGDYSLAAPAGNFTVRVVNSSVTSSRTGYVASLLPVQTFRTNAPAGTAVAVTDRVGGETPNLADAGNGSTTLVALTTATTTAQSIAAVTVAAVDVTGIDFGFNFDTVVNVNDTGQGSLRQFVTNANALDNSGLAQSGLVSGKDNAVFMISNGTAAAGLRAANNYFTGGVASIAPASALPTVTDPAVFNATLQPGFASAPVVELNGTGAGGGSNGLTISAGNSVVAGFVINRFNGSGISLSAAGSNTITGNYLGTNAAGTAASANVQHGIDVVSGNSSTIGGTTAGSGNLISGNTGSGINLRSGVTGTTIQGNNIGTNVTVTAAVANGTGITLTAANNNTIGGASAGAANIIAFNTARGINVVSGTGNAISRNSIYGNTNLGLDLGSNGVTGNNGTLNGALANQDMDYPVFNNANLVGTTLSVSGYIGSAAGQAAFANATIEIFKADNSPADQNGESIAGDGQSVAHGEGRTYLGTITADAAGNFSTSIAVAGLALGDYITATARNATNDTSEFSTNRIVASPGALSGNVFEDSNYGGGAGRSKAASGGTGRPNARVELYDGSGNFVTFTTTDATGDYAFASIVAGNYTVRVVNSSVTSFRTGYVGSLLPVQTYRTNASSGAAVAQTDRVGGETPNLADAGNGSTTLAALTTGTTTAQSITAVTLGVTPITGVDFGFNFDTVVNVNDSGQGSLRQFLTNANALSNSGLAQTGLVAGKDNAVFMISNGTSAAGLRAANNYFAGGIATIAPATGLPTITDPIVVDATIQPGFVAAPVIELNGTGAGAGANGLTISAGSSVVRGLIVNRFLASGVALSGAGGNTVQGNYLGTDSNGASASANGQQGVYLNGSPNNTIGGTTATARNVISGNTLRGIFIDGAGATGNTITGNYVGLNAAGTGAVANTIGIYLNDAPSNTIGGTAAGSGNIISGNTQIGLYFVAAGTTGNVAQGNVIGLNATATGSVPNGTSGVEFTTGASNNTLGGTAAGAGNVISGNGARGIRVITGTGNRIQRNSIFGNTGVGIDLGSDNVTGNNGAVGGGPNNGMDYPIFGAASLSGGTLSISGFVGSAPGQAAFANATIEIFKVDNVPADQNGEKVLGDGQSVAHGEGRTYLGTVTADGSGNFNTSIGVAGLSTGDFIVATASNAGNDTSEFGPNIAVASGGAISGFVYLDANLNIQRDNGEDGTGLTLYVKAFSSASPSGPALQAATVDPVTGAYALAGMSPGTYTLVLDDNNTLSDVTPAVPAGWTYTEQANGQHTPVAVGAAGVPNQNFGLYHGTLIRGLVFNDNGAGGGTPNDGIRNGTEAGIGGVTVRLTDNSGATTYSTATTNSAGDYALAIPSTVAAGTVLKIVETNANGYASTGASLGNTAGSYDRPTDTLTFTRAANTSYTGVDFADTAGNTLNTDGQQAGLPGTTVYYPHTFYATSAGNVTFSTSSTQTPALSGWTQTLYRDLNNDGILQPAEPVITGAISMTAGQTISILVKTFIPTNAPFGAKDSTVVSATFAFTGASPGLSTSPLTRTDVTTVGNPTTAGLTLVKSVDKPTALPGEVITYTVTYTNNSTDILRNVIIYDTTPAFTRFTSANNGALPLDLTGVSIANPAVNATGAIRWTFTGTLRPGGSGTVTFKVTLDQ